VLRRCLTRELDGRARDIGDVKSDLEERDSSGPTPGRQARPGHPLVAWSAAGLMALALGVTAAVVWRRPPPDAPEITRSTLELPSDQRLALSPFAYPLALSPDGRRVAYVGEVDGQAQLYVRELDDPTPRAIAGSAGARQPFFSQDGQSVAFFVDGALQKAGLADARPLRICQVSGASVGGSWASDGTIVFATENAPLSRVSASGGLAEPIAGTDGAIWPQVLPDGRTVLFTLGTRRGFAVIPITGGQSRVVASAIDGPAEGGAILGSTGIHPARYVSSGHLLYGQDPGHIRVLEFDLTQLRVIGSPVAYVTGVERGGGGGAVFFAPAEAGENLVFVSTGSRHQLVWVDRSGNESLFSGERNAFRQPRLSPDGRRVAVSVSDETRRSDIWIYDVARGTRTRATTRGHNLAPVWHPTGALVYSAEQAIEEIAADGSGRIVTLVQMRPAELYPTSWSSDGRNLLFQTGPATRNEILVFDRDTRAIQRILAGPYSNEQAQFAPDGRTMAFVTDETGRREVYVVRYPQLDRKTRVSTMGGTDPRWSRDRAELFYRQGDAVMSVQFALPSGGEFRVGTPGRLFSGPYSGVSHSQAYSVSLDSKRFIMVKSDEAATLKRLTLVQHWLADLRRTTSERR
jgi:Tol biopolymer transport system component